LPIKKPELLQIKQLKNRCNFFQAFFNRLKKTEYLLGFFYLNI